MLENYTRNAYEDIRENTGETLEETQNTDQISNDKIGEFKMETEEDLHGDDQHGDDQVMTRRGVGCHFHLISS